MSESWSGRRVFVTGGTGLIGSWLVGELVEAGAEVICLVRDQVPETHLERSGGLARVTRVAGDVTDQRLLERALGEYEIEGVFHLAAQTIVGVANRNPVGTFETNLRGTWSLLEACRRSPRVGAVVVASSDKAYGPQPRLPYDETMPLQGIYPYDVSKSCTDLLAQSYAATYHSRIAITRCGNVFGGGDLNWNRLVPGTLRAALRGERPVIRSDGQFVRDYVYVEDVAAAYLLLAERLSGDDSLAGEAFNLSYEQPLTVLQLVERILALLTVELTPEICNEASAEIREQYLSAAKARERLGWRPRFALEEGLRRTIAWYRDYLR